MTEEEREHVKAAVESFRELILLANDTKEDTLMDVLTQIRTTYNYWD
jgi:hypothetical protein